MTDRGRTICIAVAGAVSLSACDSSPPPVRSASTTPVRMFGLQVSELKDCTVARSEIAKRVKIVVTKETLASLGTSAPTRSVYAFGKPGEDGDDHDDSDVKPGNLNRPKEREPFHIFLNAQEYPATVIANTPYLLVRVVLKEKSGFNFYPNDPNNTSGRIQGVSATNGTPDTLCAAPSPDRAIVFKGKRQVAKFYVDLREATKPGYIGPFNIIIVPESAPETITIIDPRIRFDG